MLKISKPFSVLMLFIIYIQSWGKLYGGTKRKMINLLPFEAPKTWIQQHMKATITSPPTLDHHHHHPLTYLIIRAMCLHEYHIL